MEVLIKKTSYARSISITQEEFDACASMKYDRIEVRSMVGKLVRVLPCSVYSKLLMKAKLLLVNNDPSQKHYWVINF